MVRKKEVELERSPRVEVGVFKLPKELKGAISEVSATERRSMSETIYFLVAKGLKEYRKTGRLFDSRDELDFLRS